MRKTRTSLNKDETIRLKNAQKSKLGWYFIMITFFSLFLIGVILFGDAPMDSGDKDSVFGYLFQLIPVLGIVLVLKSILNYNIDIWRGFKIVMITNCRKTTSTGENGVISYSVIVDDYKEFTLEAYNKQYLNCFLEKNELYELHFAPWSRVILQVKKIRE